jgi:acyl-CoA synthetase (AMP-forming)/AMP-acid ligase II
MPLGSTVATVAILLAAVVVANCQSDRRSVKRTWGDRYNDAADEDAEASMNIAECLRPWVATSPTGAAILDPRRTDALTFAELDRAAAQLVTVLEAQGIQPGDRALLCQPMSAELYIALLALLRLGVVAMFVDPLAGVAHLNRCCAAYPPQVVIANAWLYPFLWRSPRLRAVSRRISIGFPLPGTVTWQTVQHSSPCDRLVPRTADDPAILTFTSGSTGEPKPIVRSHGFLFAQHQALTTTLALAPGSCNVSCLPIFILSNLGTGVTSLIPDANLRRLGTVRAPKILKQFHQYHPDSLTTSPAFLTRLVEYCERHRVTLPSLQSIHLGGAPVFPSLLRRIEHMAPHAKILIVYGATEAEPIAAIAHLDILPEDWQSMSQGKGLLVGTPAPDLQLRIADSAPIPAVSDHAGEILVRGAHVLVGDSAGGWHSTGDAGYVDDRGRLWLLGRMTGRIVDAYGTLYPLMVEAIAHQFPEIRRAALVEHRHQRVLVLELERRAGRRLRGDRFAQLQRQLAPFHIHHYRYLRSIPVDRRHQAKIRYPALRARLEGRFRIQNSKFKVQNSKFKR